jgi:hypothetical protein
MGLNVVFERFTEIQQQMAEVYAAKRNGKRWAVATKPVHFKYSQQLEPGREVAADISTEIRTRNLLKKCSECSNCKLMRQQKFADCASVYRLKGVVWDTGWARCSDPRDRWGNGALRARIVRKWHFPGPPDKCWELRKADPFQGHMQRQTEAQNRNAGIHPQDQTVTIWNNTVVKK